MKQEGAHFIEIRMRNRKLLRNLMREHKMISKTEIAKLSGLSFPTVTAALNDMIELGEVKQIEGAISNGGRPGAMYALNSEYQYASCGYLNETQLEMRIYDVFGEVKKTFIWKVDTQLTVNMLLQYMREIKSEFVQLSMLVMGIPGVVWEGRITHLPCFPKLEQVEIVSLLENALEVQVFVENDINTIAYAQVEEYQDFAHVFFSQGCIGTGIVIDGKLVRGAHGSAGELEYACSKEEKSCEYLAKAITVLACVIDMPYLFISGDEVKEEDRQKLMSLLKEKLPAERLPKLIYVADEEKLYFKGLWLMVLDEWKQK